MSVYFIFSASPFVYSSCPQRNLSITNLKSINHNRRLLFCFLFCFVLFSSLLGRIMWRWMVSKRKGSARKIFITSRLIEIALIFFSFLSCYWSLGLSWMIQLLGWYSLFLYMSSCTLARASTSWSRTPISWQE